MTIQSKNKFVIIGLAVIAAGIVASVLMAGGGGSKVDKNKINSDRPPSDVENVPDDDVSVEMLAEAIGDERGFAGLSVDQQQKLVRRVTAITQVRDNGTAQDYVSLMESWGGSFPNLPGNASESAVQAYGDRLISNWQGKGHEYGVSQRYIEQASIRVASRGEPGEANRRPAKKMTASSARITSFHFDDDVKALAAEGTMALEVSMPIVLNNGIEREEGFLMLWSEKEEQWLPYMRFARQKKESPSEAVGFYMSFF